MLNRVILIVMSCAGDNDFHDSFADLGARRYHREDSAPPLLSLPQQLTRRNHGVASDQRSLTSALAVTTEWIPQNRRDRRTRRCVTATAES